MIFRPSGGMFGHRRTRGERWRFLQRRQEKKKPVAFPQGDFRREWNRGDDMTTAAVRRPFSNSMLLPTADPHRHGAGAARRLLVRVPLPATAQQGRPPGASPAEHGLQQPVGRRGGGRPGLAAHPGERRQHWHDSMKIGMTFGVLFGALLHTVLRYYPLKVGKNLYLNSLRGRWLACRWAFAPTARCRPPAA